jgi:hypothetical protein
MSHQTPHPGAGTCLEGFAASHAWTPAGAKPSETPGGSGTHVAIRQSNPQTEAGHTLVPHPPVGGTTPEVTA